MWLPPAPVEDSVMEPEPACGIVLSTAADLLGCSTRCGADAPGDGVACEMAVGVVGFMLVHV